MYSIIALWVCFAGVHCQYVNGPYATPTACFQDRDLFNRNVSMAQQNVIYECRQKTVPAWDRLPDIK